MSVRRESKEERYDVVVVGSGIGGLSAAALLAKHGKKTLVLERHDRPGGYAHAFQRKRYHFDSAVHLVGGAEGGIIDALLRTVGVRERVGMIRVDPFYRVVFPGESADVPTSVEGFVRANSALFPEEGRGIRAFIEVCRKLNAEVRRFPSEPSLLRLLRVPAEYPTLFKYRNSTLQDALDEFIDDARAKAVLSSLWVYLGLPPSKLSFLYFTTMLMSYIDEGAYYCQGTFQNLANALVEAIRRDGGEVMVLARVRKITVEDGEVNGVILENGQRITAPVVISNADARQTFEELVGAEHIPKHFMKRLERMRPSLSAFVLFLATDLDLAALGGSHETLVYTTWDQDETYKLTLDGVPAVIGVDIPTLVDPSLAPNGEHLVIATCLIPYEVGSSWREKKSAYSELVVEQLEKLYPGIRQHITYSEGASPRTMERYTLNITGSIYGWAVSPDQVGLGRLGHRTPIKGLFLSGHWTQPGGGIYGVVVSGIQTAGMVLDREMFDEVGASMEAAAVGEGGP